MRKKSFVKALSFLLVLFFASFSASSVVNAEDLMKFPIATTAGIETAFSSAFDGTNYLIAFQEDGGAVKARFISQTGTQVGSAIAVGLTGGIPAVAFDGTNYLIVSPESVTTIKGQFVSQAGALVGLSFDIANLGTGIPFQDILQTIQIIFDGNNYFVAWGDGRDLKGRFISTAGGNVGPPIIIVSGTGPDPGIPSVFKVTKKGNNILAVWADGRRASSGGCDYCPMDIYGQFITKSGVGAAGALSGSNFAINLNDDWSDMSTLGLAFDGTNYLVAWNDMTPGTENARLYAQMVSTSGTLVGSVINTENSFVNSNRDLPSLSFDGSNYLLIWTVTGSDFNGDYICDVDEGTCFDIYGQYISTSGTFVGSEFAIDNSSGNQIGALAYGGSKYLVLINDIDTFDGTVGDVYGKFLGEAGTGARIASGTYTWDSGAGVLTVNTASSDFLCDGLLVGEEIINEVAVTADTMTWSKDGIVDVAWTRSPSGTAGDVVGVWTMNDPSGSSWVLTINNDTTFTLAAVIMSCGSGGGSGTGPHNADGTYIYTSETGLLEWDWTSSDFTCEGPGIEQGTVTVTSLTATSLTWEEDDGYIMTWTRLSGSAGDILGTWESLDEASGNTWAITFNANGNVSLAANIVDCGSGGGNENPRAQAQHWPDGYYVNLQYEDPNHDASSVSVTGPGITGSLSLAYDDSGQGSWNSWTLPSNSVFFGTESPAGLPYTYTFSITDGTGPWTADSIVSCFQEEFATNLSPSGTVEETPTFSWTGISDAGVKYGLEVNDADYNRIWSSYDISGTSMLYNGPPLISGETYNYFISLMNSTACSSYSSSSFAQGSFVYGSSADTAVTGVNNFFTQLAGTVNDQGVNLAYTHLNNSFFYASFFNDGLNGTVGSKQLAERLRGLTIDGWELQNVNYYDEVNQIISVGGIITFNGIPMYMDGSKDGFLIFKSDDGGVTWKSYGNQQVAKTGFQVEMRIDSMVNETIGPLQRISFEVIAPLGNISSVSVTGPGIIGSFALTTHVLHVETVTGDPALPGEQLVSDKYFGGVNLVSPVGSGSAYTFTIIETLAGGGETRIYTVTYTGTAVTDPVNGSIAVTSPTGHALADANLGNPLTVNWTLPTVFQIAAVYLGGYVATAPDGGGTQCPLSAPELAPNATSGTLTLPTTCAGQPVVSVWLIVSADGFDGERALVLYVMEGDTDNDGFTEAQGDCNDNDNTIYPGADEICDGIDNNCDTQIDEGCEVQTYDLTINITGTGTGTVTSDPTGIDCGGDCSEIYTLNTSVTLTATASEGSIFTGWSGNADCSDGSVTMDAAKSCTATFALDGTGAHNASGTYTWDSGTGVLAVNTTASDFICDGLSVGEEIINEVAVTADTMTWSKDGIVDLAWTRSPSGAAGDIVGVWTMNDPSGSSWTMTINSNNTLSLAAVIVSCGEGGNGNNTGRFPIATALNKEVAFSSAFDGTNYLIAFQDEVGAAKAQFVSQSGALVGPAIAVGLTGGMPAVAFDGTNYLIVLPQSASTTQGQRVSTTGVLVGSSFNISTLGTSIPFQDILQTIHIIFDGNNYFVAWGDGRNHKGRFVSPAGTVVGSPITIVSGTGPDPDVPSVFNISFDGSKILAVWADGRRASSGGCDYCPMDIYGQFITKSGVGTPGALSGSNFAINVNDDWSDMSTIGLAFDGTNYLVAWNDMTPGTENARLYAQLVSTSGALVGSVINTENSFVNYERDIPFLAFDGSDYLLIWTYTGSDFNGDHICDVADGTCFDIYGQYISTSGAFIGSEFVIENSSGNQAGALGYGGGKYLVLINDFDTFGGTVGDVYGKFLGGAETGSHNASGTYTFTSETGLIEWSWNTSDFICEGPGIEQGTDTVTSLTATTLIWGSGQDEMIWTRPSGADGDILGTWMHTDNSTGNTYTIIFNVDGTVSLAANIVQCSGNGGGGGDENPSATSRHWSDGYYVHFQYIDSPQTATSVSVTGPGIPGSLSLDYAINGSWHSAGYNFFIADTSPIDLPYTYTFTIDDSTGIWTADSTVSCFQEPFATNISPSGTVPEPPTFRWTGIGDPSAIYSVEMRDDSTFYWNGGTLSGTSILYDGPALTPGTTYTYYVEVQSSSSCSNGISLAQGSFTYQSAATGSISGTVSYLGSNTGTVYLGLFNSPDITPDAHFLYGITISVPGVYTIGNVPDGTYFVGAIRTNDIDNIQMTDPYGMYGIDFLSSDFIPDSVTVSGGAAVIEKDFMMIDGTVENPNPFYVGWIENPSNGHLYKHIVCVTWEDCESMAVAAGAHLVTINDAEENSWIVQALGSEQTCIGYTDKISEGTWVWASGELSGYTNWGDGEPNNFNDEDYAVINFPLPGQWNDVPDCGSAIMELQLVTLNVSKAGAGTGTVTSDPAGINCGATCSANYNYNTPVTLTAAASGGSTFTGWSGNADCSDGIVTMDAAKSCTATFNVAPTGVCILRDSQTSVPSFYAPDIGSGYAKVSRPGINDLNSLRSVCTTDDYDLLLQQLCTQVTISPSNPAQQGVVTYDTAGEPSSSACGPDIECVSRTSCGSETYTLTVNKDGTGTGTVSGTGIDCGDDCTETYNHNTVVTLTATPAPGSTFTGWSGDDDCTDGSVTMDAAKSCTATFDIAPVADVTPYTSGAKTILLDHFNGATLASILAYRETGASCGPAKASATPNSSYSPGTNFLGQALNLNPPIGEPVGSTTYLKYSGGQLLSQPNGTIELWTYLTSYGTGVSFVQQGPYPGSCAGWTFSMGVNSAGQLQAGAWAAFNMNSGGASVPLNTWTHVAATWGSTGAKLYINGALVGSDANTGKPASGYGGSVMVNYNAGSGTKVDELHITSYQRTIFVPDVDGDNISDINDLDNDNDGIPDASDSSPFNPKVCGLDTDGDTCDDCSNGTYNPANDGTDVDANGICETEYGDAGAGHPSLRINSGANHINIGREWLGVTVDGENDSRQVNKDTFDDGVVFKGLLKAGQPVDLEVTVSVFRAADTGRYNPALPEKRIYLNAWLDWNGDGDWNDPGEKIIGTGSGVTYAGFSSNTVPIDPTVSFEAGKNSRTYIFRITPPSDWPVGSYARFRLDYGEDAGSLQNQSGTLAGALGTAQFGEVEDYLNPLISSSSVGNAGDSILIADSGSDINGTVMNIPPGALSGEVPVNITIQKLQNISALPPTPKGGMALSVDFGPNGTVFETPVTVVIPHDPAMEHDETPQVYYWDEENSVWSTDGISNVIYDELSNPHTITFDVMHFSVFSMDMGDVLIDFDLAQGWNLISIPRQPRDTVIDTSLNSVSGLYNIVWAYENSEWMMNNPNTPIFNTLETMESGKGYWIYMASPETLTVSGSIPSNSVPLASGWNLVGYNSRASMPIEDILASIDGKYISVWAFINGEWQFYAPGNIFNTLETMQPGYGYWINTTEECTWTLP